VYNSLNAQIVYWQKFRREIFWDLDGSITGVVGGAYITPYKPHMAEIPGCVVHSEAKWDNSIICAMN
jgi:hypothetical protein